MGWDKALAASATYAKPEEFETFRRHIDAGWIEQALAATGTAIVRRRRLPVEEVVWVFLGEDGGRANGTKCRLTRAPSPLTLTERRCRLTRAPSPLTLTERSAGSRAPLRH